MARKRWKRKSGYVTPKATILRKHLEEEGLFVNPIYDDWEDYRDGLREWFKDFKLIRKLKGKILLYCEDLFKKRIRMNKKQKKLSKIRKTRKLKRNLVN